MIGFEKVLLRGLVFAPEECNIECYLRVIYIHIYTLRCWKLRFLRVKKRSVSFAGGRREFRFPTVAIRRSLLQTFGAQLRKINRC